MARTTVTKTTKAERVSSESPVRTRDGGRRIDVRLDTDSATCMTRLETLADLWGGELTRDGVTRARLTLPVRAGVRRGVVEGTVSLRGSAPCQLRFDVESNHYRVQYAAFLFLLLGALGGAIGILVPFFPRLLPLMPVSLIFAVGAWLFIVARLTNSGPEEFFAELASFVAEPERESAAEE